MEALGIEVPPVLLQQQTVSFRMTKTSATCGLGLFTIAAMSRTFSRRLFSMEFWSFGKILSATGILGAPHLYHPGLTYGHV